MSYDELETELRSTKETKKEKEPIIPIIAEEEGEKITGIELSVGAFRWADITYVNIETEKKVRGKIWELVGSASLVPIQMRGRKVLKGNKIVGRVYGFKAIAQALAGRFPCSVEEAKKLVEEAKASGSRHILLILQSDLTPTSPEKFMGKNKWIAITNFPDTQTMHLKLNKALKASGSPLRIETALRRRLVEG